MNNLIIAQNYETFGDEGLTSNKVIYYKEDNMVKFRANITDDPYGESEVVTVGGGGSDIPKDYNEQYLTFEALENGTFTFSPVNDNEIYYSKDGKNWTKGNTVAVTTGDKVMWKGNLIALEQDHGGIGNFGSTTTRYNIQGNILSILYGDNFKTHNEVTQTYVFNCLFRYSNCVDAYHLIMPSTLSSYCFFKMFKNCSSLIKCPELPATTLTQFCYSQMFMTCANLVDAPTVIPATTLANSCCLYMFDGDSNLENAPVLPAATLQNNSYGYMFRGCSKLNFIKCLATNISASYCLSNWLNGVSATGIFIAADNTPSWPRNANGVPSGWKLCTVSEEMPLYQADSYNMVATFEDDTTLTTKIYIKP